MKIFTRTRIDAHAPQQPEPGQAETGGVLMRFLTAGGATLELRSKRFKNTRIDSYRSADRPYEVDGFIWECLGCGADGRGACEYQAYRYLPKELSDAREDANEHATVCRAMPRPGVTS